MSYYIIRKTLRVCLFFSKNFSTSLDKETLQQLTPLPVTQPISEIDLLYISFTHEQRRFKVNKC